MGKDEPEEKKCKGYTLGKGKRVYRLVANRAQDKVFAREAHCLRLPINPHLQAASANILIAEPFDSPYQ